MDEQSAAEDRIWEIVRSLNRACLEGRGGEAIRPHLHAETVTVTPGFSSRVAGREACQALYDDLYARARFFSYEESDPHVDLFATTAVVTYRYDCVWEIQGSRHHDLGHEVLTFVLTDGQWQLAWRARTLDRRQTTGEATAPGPNELAPPDDALDRRCRLLLATAPVCYLTTIDGDGFPHATAMNNLANRRQYPSLADLDDRDLVVYLSTDTRSEKMARIRSNPRVSVYFCDPAGFFGLMLGGRIVEITDPDLKRRIWQPGWSIYYPSGIDGEEYGVLRLTPTIAKGWSPEGHFVLPLAEASAAASPKRSPT